MKKIVFLCIVSASIFLLGTLAVTAQEEVEVGVNTSIQQFPTDEYARGQVIKVVGREDFDRLKLSEIVQQARVRILSGTEKGKEVIAQNSITTNVKEGFLLNGGESVVIVKTSTVNGVSYYVTDMHRLPSLGMIVAVFIGLVIIFGRLRGAMAITGLAFSILLLVEVVVPQILQGRDPLLVSIGASCAIVFVSLYLAHGFRQRTTIALVSTLITLGLSAALAIFFVKTGRLFGTGTEEALFLQMGSLEAVNLQGLLLGGIIIGTLGVLDDITTAQAAAVEELRNANERLGFRELFRRGISIGNEHIASLVNTLALAYAGVSLPLFLLFTLNQSQPLWVILNSEQIAEEIVRALVGSSALILAVPITTALAAWHFSKKRKEAFSASPK
jgi:uncharacterized membrane protein